MKKILVLCTGNSCRSQMLHGFLKQYSSLEVYSAGVETHGVNPLAVQVMKEIGVDISDHTSNNVAEYQHMIFDLVITVCDNARERCPFFPGGTERIHKNFTDPAKVNGNRKDSIAAFQKVRDQIREFSDTLAERYLF